MGWNKPDLYYQPEKFGLTVVGEVEWSEAGYSFDTTVVWIDDNKNLYWASDSGCSCPSPFEDLNSLDDAATGNWEALRATLDARLGQEIRIAAASSYREKEAKHATEQVVALLAKAWQATRPNKEANVNSVVHFTKSDNTSTAPADQ